MEKREEETEIIQTKRTRRRQSSSSSSLPSDQASTILEKLPAKSVLRFCFETFRCVSKLWSSITTDPYFISSFETRSSSRPNLLLFFREDDKFFAFTIPQQNPNPNEPYSYSTSKPIASYHMTHPKNNCRFVVRTESVHGLICFQKLGTPIIIIWNPTMRKLLPLPKPDTSWKDITVFLGYDPIEGKHKLVCMPFNETCDECRVLTLGSAQDKSWRTVKTNQNHFPDTGDRTGVYGRCINGVLYYQADIDDGYKEVIMSFDVKSEKFTMIPFSLWSMDMMMISYEGKLAFVNDGILMMVLEDADKHEWSKHTFSGLSHYDDEGLRNNYKLIGSTDDGELFYSKNRNFKSFDIIFIHPKRKTFRRVGYRGIVDDGSRARNELEHKSFCLQIFPNHVETLMSL